MAGAKLSARQKMINLMYLVFIAMLALNMGKKVLSSFGYLNEKLQDANTTAISDIEGILMDLSTKASEQPDKYGVINEKAIQINQLSSEFYSYLGSVKDSLMLSVDPEKQTDYESMDSETAGDEFFFTGEKLTPSGEAFVAKIASYKEGVVAIMGDKMKEDLLNNLTKRFDTSDQEVKGLPQPQPWIRNRFEGFPLVATLTNISVMQSDVKTSEKEIYNTLLGKQLSADASISNSTYKAIVIPSKPAYFAGEEFKGTIVLGRYDASLKPEKVVINGSTVSGRENGAAVVKFRTSKLGENTIKGSFVFKQDGKEVLIPITSSYLVVSKPNSAVVSADKMNVVYRGVDNPITISMPGVSDSNVNASAQGLRKASGVGKYTMNPGSGSEVVINVTGKTSDGTVIKSPPVSFRIKDIPAPAAAIRREVGSISLPKSSLAKSEIEAVMMDFDFDLNLSVTSFKIKVPGQPTVVVNGSRLDSRAQSALLNANRGDVISIFDIKASLIGNSSYRLKGVLPLSVEITN